MTETEIRALDGPALTRLAYELGLAPDGTVYWLGDDWPYDTAARKPWEPHTNLAQADAVFRRLRARGWSTEVYGTSTEGWCRASKGDAVVEACWPAALVTCPTEAHGLLQVAVLALAPTPAPGEGG